jgi:hypothetical protein
VSWRASLALTFLVLACGTNGSDAPRGSAGASGTATAAAGGSEATGGAGTGGSTAGSSSSGAGGASATDGKGGSAGEATGGKAGSGAAGKGGVAAAGDGGTSGAGAGSAGRAGTGACVADGSEIRVEGRNLLVGGCPLYLRGVCWNPVPKGEGHPGGLDYPGAAPGDGALMEVIGINVVRTYEPLTNRDALDAPWEHGIRVLVGTYVYGGDAASVVTARVNAVKDHPAVLGWVLGNEWNYNGLYTGLSHAESLARLNEAADLVRAADTTHPIVSVYGEVPAADTLAAMPEIDIWGINAYRGISFGDLFEVWAARSEKPMFLSEYGADAYNATTDAYDPMSQAMAVGALTQEIADNAVAYSASGVAIGGTIFEWSDEWWKDSMGTNDVHDVGGIAPGGGPYPDQTFNEEWWGLVDVDRVTRPAYDALGDVFEALPR